MTHSWVLPAFTAAPVMMLWMNVAGGVNCSPGSVDRKRGRLLRSEIAPNWPARKLCEPALLLATISPSVTLTYTLGSRLSLLLGLGQGVVKQSSAPYLVQRIPIVAVAVP